MMGVMSHRWGWAALIPAIFAAIFPAAAFAQWLSYPTPNVPPAQAFLTGGTS
jgi:hypothetical protein